MSTMTNTATLAKFGLLDIDMSPANNDLPPTPSDPGDYGVEHDDDRHGSGCDYCGRIPWRREPFGGRLACRPCFMQIVSGE